MIWQNWMFGARTLNFMLNFEFIVYRFPVWKASSYYYCWGPVFRIPFCFTFVSPERPDGQRSGVASDAGIDEPRPPVLCSPTDWASPVGAGLSQSLSEDWASGQPLHSLCGGAGESVPGSSAWGCWQEALQSHDLWKGSLRRKGSLRQKEAFLWKYICAVSQRVGLVEIASSW